MITAPDDMLGNLVNRGLEEIAAVKRDVDGWVVTTHCMYPSNGLVRVTVRGGEQTVVVSDEGGAFGEALSAGIPVRDYDRTLGNMVKEQGLFLKNHVIFTPGMPINA